MRYCSIAVLLAGSCLTACKRVTAPEALEVADDLEHQVWRGKLPSLDGSTLSSAWLNFKGRSTVIVSTNEATQPLEALVVRPPGSRVLRWTVSYPDGSVLERDSTIDYPGRPIDRPWLDDCAKGVKYGGRRQCLVPESGLAKKSAYGVLVLTMEDDARR